MSVAGNVFDLVRGMIREKRYDQGSAFVYEQHTIKGVPISDVKEKLESDQTLSKDFKDGAFEMIRVMMEGGDGKKML